MKFIHVIILAVWVASSECLPKRVLKSIPVVDALIQRLEAEEWADDEACYRATLQILYGVKNDTLWATWVWDSMQPPVGVFYGTGAHIGNFDQCINTPRSSHQDLSTQYCVVEVKVSPKEAREFGAYDSADEYLNTLTLPGRSLFNLNFGTCMPAVCSPSSISKFYRHVLQLTHLPDAEIITVDPDDCQTAVPKPYPGKLSAYLYVFGALLITVIVSTVYTQLYSTQENSITDYITKSFCLARNWNDLFKVNKNEIRVLNGMRVISSLLVVAYHQFMSSLFLPNLMTNSVEVDKMFDGEIGQALIHIDLVVDTFFSISGMLLIRGLLGGRQKNLLVVLIKRYFRLIGPYAAVTFYIICVARHTGSGPMWLRANANEEGVCENYWWKNIFMMNNDIKTMCVSVAWYVNCDYQLAVLTLLLFWVYRKHRKTGVAAFVAISIGLTVQLAVKAYTKGLPLVVFNNFNKFTEGRDFVLLNEVYIRWHDRAGSYFIGVAMGALMTMYKPAEHRNAISKTTSFALVLTSLFVMLKVASINYWFSGGPVLVASAVATHRAVWAMAVCGLIAASEYGNADPLKMSEGVVRGMTKYIFGTCPHFAEVITPYVTGCKPIAAIRILNGFLTMFSFTVVCIVSDFLGSSVFVPLGKLTYGIYMTHFYIMQRNVHVSRTPSQFEMFNVIVSTLGIAVLASAVALVLFLLVEAPCINLSNVCFSERSEKTKINGEIKANGIIHRNGNNGILSHYGTDGITKVKAL